MRRWIEKQKPRRLKEREFACSLPDLAVSQKGELAKQMLDNPLYKEVIVKIENDLYYLWNNSQTEDRAGRERTWNMLQMLRKIDRTIVGYLNEALYELRIREESTTSEETESARR